MKKLHCTRKNTIWLRVTAWLLCTCLIAAFLFAKPCESSVFAAEKREGAGEEDIRNLEQEETLEVLEGTADSGHMEAGILQFVEAPETEETDEEQERLEENGAEGKRLSRTEEIVPEQTNEEINAEAAVQASEEAAQRIIEINEDKAWYGSPLGGTYIVKKGVTLTLAGQVSIEADITITGEGVIKRVGDGRLRVGNGHGYSNYKLTLDDITVDGESVSSEQPIIYVERNSSVTLKGCRFYNCVNNTGNGGVLRAETGSGGGDTWMDAGTVDIADCSFVNCSAIAGKGGAVYINGKTSNLADCTFENCSAEDGGAFYGYNGTMNLTRCTFKDCSAENGGAAYRYQGTTNLADCSFTGCSAKSGGAIKADYGIATLENLQIENCSATRSAGAVYAYECKNVTINGGTYKNNKASGETGTGKGGGCIMNHASKLYINGGEFSDNTSDNRGGFLYNGGNQGTETYLNGGTFSGNTCTNTGEKLGLEGSGAIFCSSNITNPDTILQLSGKEIFTGGADGTDGIYLDFAHNLPRYLQIASKLEYPVKVYLKADALDRYVVAKGTEGYKLTEEDKDQITFVDVETSEKKWYSLLDAKNNRIILSKIDPKKTFRIYYDSNGAKGKVEDLKEYTILDSITVQSGDGLTYEGKYLNGWNTNVNGNGYWHYPGDTIEYISQDITLYAKFLDIPKASFYSGENNEPEVLLAEGMGPKVHIGKVKVPVLRRMGDWEAIGWAASPTTFGYANVAAGSEISLTENDSYYGVYQKWVTLTYDANGGDVTPGKVENWAYANVGSEKTTYSFFEYSLAPGVTRTDGYHFLNWNTKKDGSGKSYLAGSSWSLENDTTLYAQWTKEPTAEYTVEHYKQDAIGEGYTKAETEQLEGDTGTTVSAAGKSYTGFTENMDHPERKASGEITADGALVLKLYYDRDSYEILFDLNGGNGEAPGKQELRYGSCLQEPEAPVREGYSFLGWYKDKEGNEGSQWAFEKPVEENTSSCMVTLYANWSENRELAAEYTVEHYKQDITGEGYTKAESEQLKGDIGTTASATGKSYMGFTENTAHPKRKVSGEITADGALVLKLYYDRDSYGILFDLNGGSGEAPEKQELRYGSLLQEPETPIREGYSFKGWYKEKEGTEGNRWEFGKPVEENAASQTVTLYAKWVDDIAPVFGEASFSEGYKDLFGWMLSKKDLTVTVPIRELGSGVKQVDYLLVPVKDAGVHGENLLAENPYRQGECISKASEGLWRNAEIETEHGQVVTKVAITEDFKGKVLMACSDHAGNRSEVKIIPVGEGGIIVEGNPPEIRFSSEDGELSQWFLGTVSVNVTVNDGEDGRITSGIASIRYQVDDEKEEAVSFGEFGSKIVESHKFTVDISSEGKHFLKVTAIDHAGNETERQVQIKIKKPKAQKPIELKEQERKPEEPGNQEKEPQAPEYHGNEPGTGEASHVELCIVIFLMAGIAFLLLGSCLEEKE